uniref:Uncharacterized protein n=1 Tax=Arundo donax TaxID=35708 RepID=A0A0A8ZGP4_ARUDO
MRPQPLPSAAAPVRQPWQTTGA